MVFRVLPSVQPPFRNLRHLLLLHGERGAQKGRRPRPSHSRKVSNQTEMVDDQLVDQWSGKREWHKDRPTNRHVDSTFRYCRFNSEVLWLKAAFVGDFTDYLLKYTITNRFTNCPILWQRWNWLFELVRQVSPVVGIEHRVNLLQIVLPGARCFSSFGALFSLFSLDCWSLSSWPWLHKFSLELRDENFKSEIRRRWNAANASSNIRARRLDSIYSLHAQRIR